MFSPGIHRNFGEGGERFFQIVEVISQNGKRYYKCKGYVANGTKKNIVYMTPEFKLDATSFEGGFREVRGAVFTGNNLSAEGTYVISDHINRWLRTVPGESFGSLLRLGNVLNTVSFIGSSSIFFWLEGAAFAGENLPPIVIPNSIAKLTEGERAYLQRLAEWQASRFVVPTGARASCTSCYAYVASLFGTGGLTRIERLTIMNLLSNENRADLKAVLSNFKGALNSCASMPGGRYHRGGAAVIDFHVDPRKGGDEAFPEESLVCVGVKTN